jgi:SAM-dependent methyltransferase
MESLLERTVEEVRRDRVFELLPDTTQAQISALSEEEVREGARRVMTRPQPGEVSQAGRLLLNPCLTVQWLALFEVLNLPRTMRVYEPCTGSSEPILFATEIYTDGRGEYVSLNLNRPLAAQLREKIGKLNISIQIIEDDASHSAIALEPESFDVACFHHAINDLLQTAVAEPRGMDTRTVDWWPNERQMIEWLAEEAEAGKLDERPRTALIGAVRKAVEIVKPGGHLLFDHWTWVGHQKLDWFPWELFCDLIPLARRWIEAEGLPLEELRLKDRDPRWWMLYCRV